jgi:hypothetical protein
MCELNENVSMLAISACVGLSPRAGMLIKTSFPRAILK